MAAHCQPNPTVLRQAAFGDVEPGHDLDARDDRSLQPRLRSLDLVQHAVIAVADPQPVGKRFEMNIGSVRFHGARDQLIDQPDDRRLAREILEPLGIFLDRLSVGRDFIEDRAVVSFLGLGVEPLESGVDLDRDRNSHGHGLPERGRDRLAGKAVERIDHGQENAVRLGFYRHGPGPAQELRLEAIGEKRLVGVLSRMHERDVQQLCQALGQGAFA
jgi:hypothetical protein